MFEEITRLTSEHLLPMSTAQKISSSLIFTEKFCKFKQYLTPQQHQTRAILLREESVFYKHTFLILSPLIP